MEPSLLQTVFLQNDQEMLKTINRRGSWLGELSKTIPDFRDPATEGTYLARRQKAVNELAQLHKRLEQATSKKDTATIKSIKQMIAAREQVINAAQSGNFFDGSVSEWLEQNEAQVRSIINDAYLRTLVRHPTKHELERSVDYLRKSPTAKDGLRDILWALLNTKEFALNH